MPSVNLMTSLREATREIHRRIEQLPFARALAQRRLPSMSYVGYLRVFAAIHGMIERELPRSSDARVAAMWSDDLRRSHLLQQDLDYFASCSQPGTPGVATAADRVAEDLAQRSRKRPLTLLGCLYVLEGSAHGAKVLRVWTREALDLQGSGGLAYLQGQADSVPDHWQRFCGHLDALPLNERERDTVIDGALATFAGIHRLMEMLHSAPVEPVSGRDAAGLEGRSPQRR